MLTTVNRKYLRGFTLVGPAWDNKVLDPLVELHLNNWWHILQHAKLRRYEDDRDFKTISAACKNIEVEEYKLTRSKNILNSGLFVWLGI